MKEIYIVTQYDRTVIAMECEKDAAALAERLGGKVEPVQLVECRRPQPTPRGLTDEDFGGGVVR